jgi:heme/copper-type cytochrome/quinol oxidase subunit 2
MSTRAKVIVRGIAVAVLALCVLFEGYLAYGALQGSRETGAGAAQGDLGFYMVLRVVTPIVLLVTAIAFIAGVSARRGAEFGTALIEPAALLAYVSALGIGWNWIFLFYFWR